MSTISDCAPKSETPRSRDTIKERIYQTKPQGLLHLK